MSRGCKWHAAPSASAVKKPTRRQCSSRRAFPTCWSRTKSWRPAKSTDSPDWRVKRSGTPQAGWYVVGPDPKLHGDYVPGPGYAVIFDSHGVPVWWFRQTPPVFDADLLPSGHLVWTDFVAHSPFGNGFVERTLDGRVVHTWNTAVTQTNQHDFQPLPNGHVLLVTYPAREHVDLRQWGGPVDATVPAGALPPRVRHVLPLGRPPQAAALAAPGPAPVLAGPRRAG